MITTKAMQKYGGNGTVREHAGSNRYTAENCIRIKKLIYKKKILEENMTTVC